MISVNGIHIQPTRFPDGTQQVWKLPEEIAKEKEICIVWKFDGDIEFVTIQQLLCLFYDCRVVLVLPYLPYGRQDKEISNDACFGLMGFCHLITTNRCIENVEVFDPHSFKLHTNLEYVIGWNIIQTKLPNINLLAESYDIVCFPDAGAKEKYSRYTTKPVIYGEKVRDQQTGHILSYELIGTQDLSGKKVLVVDDICDGGRTFLILAESLRSAGCEADLYISHGVFSQGQEGIDKLKKFYGKVITTNSLTCNSNPDPYYSFMGIEVRDWQEISVSTNID